jgi:uncharacterized membrane protein YraQ (UPF0718 family)
MDSASKAKIVILVMMLSALPLYILYSVARDLTEPLFASARVQLFGQTFVAILLEAFPFVILGSLVSGALEVLVSPDRLATFVPKRLGMRLLAAVTMGVVFPLCNCGIVPVARRLVRKGLPLEMAMVYMLAGPIVNPIVIASTAVAFAGQGQALWMPVARVLCGVAVAMTVGAVMARWGSAIAGVRPTDHDSHEGGGRSDGRKVLPCILGHVVQDFTYLGAYLLLGSLVAAAFQAFVPRDVLVSVGQTPVLATAGMMAMAFAMSLCSETDAFVAATFGQFSFAGRLAFLVFGPMLSFRMVAMYAGVFPRRRVAALMLIAVPLVVAVCELAGWLLACLKG